MLDLSTVGRDWLVEEVDEMSDHIQRIGPVEYNEATRYIPDGLSPRPGFIRYDLFPYLREPLECFAPWSPVREVNIKKGVQTGYTTLLESVLLYYIGQVKTQPLMFITAEKELATLRVDNNIIPMLNESDLSHLIRSADTDNKRKTGKTKNYLQWEGGGSMVFDGAMNARKMRMTSVPVMLKDELDGWKRSVGEDGNSDSLTDDRLSTYWLVRKILRGSTPLLAPSMIDEAYKNGDQRQYLVLCRACSFPQVLRMKTVNKENGIVGGFHWEAEGNVLQLDSVRYRCVNCGHDHHEHDKERLFATEHGAHWKPTADPREPGIRSYHLPAFYSPYGFRPWSKCVADYLDAYDPINKQVTDIGKYQKFYNNVLGMEFKVKGAKIRFTSVSAHRVTNYRLGSIPNKYAAEWSGSPILFLLCTVDVHKKNLAVTVQGVCRDLRTYTIDYWRFEIGDGEDDCSETTSPVWGRLRTLLEETTYTADDGQRYNIALTLVDAGYANDTVTTFCSDYAAGVYPILGRDRPAKNQTIKEFAQFTTQAGTVGYRILVDHYKDRLAPVLRREWGEENGEQKKYHFNAPVDITDKQLTELTVEIRREKVDENGNTTYVWYRPGNARNELWDLLGYTHAGAEIFAWSICIEHFELDTIDWPMFWDYAAEPENDALFGRLAPVAS